MLLATELAGEAVRGGKKASDCDMAYWASSSKDDDDEAGDTERDLYSGDTVRGKGVEGAAGVKDDDASDTRADEG
jgi:hypothetical protein